MYPPVIAVLHIGQIYNICVKLSAFLIINTDTERFFFHDNFQLFPLEHCLIFLFTQNSLSRSDTFSVSFHKIIHTVFPGGSDQTIGFFCKITVKPCPDTQDLVSDKPDTDRYTVGLYRKIRILLCYGSCLQTHFHRVFLLLFALKLVL